MLRAWSGRGGGCRCCVPLGLAIAGMEIAPKARASRIPCRFKAGLCPGAARDSLVYNLSVTILERSGFDLQSWRSLSGGAHWSTWRNTRKFPQKSGEMDSP